MTLIGISGKKKSGKDTTADIIAALKGGIVGRIGFATALKNEVSRACGVPVSYIEEHKDNFRLILQGWGTNFRRQLHGSDYWLKMMDRSLEQMAHCPLVIVSDIRFKNEYDFMVKRGAIMIRVERPNLPTDTHESETALDHQRFDITIQNDSTLEQLIQQIKNKI